jgi:hypothetical protein
VRLALARQQQAK